MMMDEKKEEPMMEPVEDEGPKPGDYVENGKFCYCFSIKCGVIFFSILLIVDFFLECYDLVVILQNEYFATMYGGVYAALVVVFFAGAVLVGIYLVMKDSQWTRALIPWGFLLAAIANFLIAIWIIVYICVIYDKDKVYVATSGLDSSSSEADDYSYAEGNPTSGNSTTSADEKPKPKIKKGYAKMSKMVYVIDHVIGPLLGGIFFLC